MLKMVKWMDNWKTVAGLLLFIVGAYAAWQSYNTVSACSSTLGQISTAITSALGGNAAQACYNAQIIEVASALVAIIGIVVIYSAVNQKQRGKK